MNAGRPSGFGGGLQDASEAAIDESGIFGTRRNLGNIRRYEYAFFAVGLIASLVTDGLTLARLVQLGSLHEPDFAYGILIIINSVFLLAFLSTGLLYQRISDIAAFCVSSLLLTVYVIAHFIASINVTDNGRNTQYEIRLARLIFTIVFNVCFVPLAYKVVKAYDRDEFAKRLFGAFPAARRPFKLYNIFDCIVRLTVMLTISSFILNLYNSTDTETLDIIFLVVGIPIAVIWLTTGIGMVRWEKWPLFFIFCILSVVQVAFLIVVLYYAIARQIDESKSSTTTTTVATITATIGNTMSTLAPVPNMIPVLTVLYVCIGANFLCHILAIIMGFICTRNFNQGLKEKVFNNRIDKWVQQRWSS